VESKTKQEKKAVPKSGVAPKPGIGSVQPKTTAEKRAPLAKPRQTQAAKTGVKKALAEVGEKVTEPTRPLSGTERKPGQPARARPAPSSTARPTAPLASARPAPRKPDIPPAGVGKAAPLSTKRPTPLAGARSAPTARPETVGGGETKKEPLKKPLTARPASAGPPKPTSQNDAQKVENPGFIVFYLPASAV